MSHTPTPWTYVHERTEYGAGDDDVTFGYLMQAGDEQYQIAPMIVDTIDGRANAELIVTAVNAYHSNQSEIERLRKALAYSAKGLDMIHNGLMDPTRPRQAVGEVCAHFLDAARTALNTEGQGNG